jgi:subtilisin family serine protease
VPAPSTIPDALTRARLPPLMAMGEGAADIVIGLLDGPVATDHPDLAGGNIRGSGCTRPDSLGCRHGTFIAGILSARRTSVAPALCPGCTLLVQPIFTEDQRANGRPGAEPDYLAEAITRCVDSGARILNLSVAMGVGSFGAARPLSEALADAARRGVITVAAAGNDGALGTSAITGAPSVLSVAAGDRPGVALPGTNLGLTLGRRGVMAPGAGVTSLDPASGSGAVGGGTSVATALVTGAVALLWSAFPTAPSGAVQAAVLGTAQGLRRSVVPPFLDAWAAYLRLRHQGG